MSRVICSQTQLVEGMMNLGLSFIHMSDDVVIKKGLYHE